MTPSENVETVEFVLEECKRRDGLSSAAPLSVV